jgi:hypothetical protein
MSPDTTPATPDPEVPLFQLAALFASDLETERLDLGEKFGPAWAGCWIEIRAMDADAYSRYLTSGQKVKMDPKTGQLSEIQIQSDLQALHLLTHSVVDFSFKRKKKAHTGDVIVEEVSTVGKVGSGKLQFMEQTFKQLTPAFRDFLVEECQRVNGFDLVQVGNLTES